MSRAKVLQKRDENGNLVTRVVFKTEDYEDLVNNQGFAPNVEKQFQYVSHVQNGGWQACLQNCYHV